MRGTNVEDVNRSIGGGMRGLGAVAK